MDISIVKSVNLEGQNHCGGVFELIYLKIYTKVGRDFVKNESEEFVGCEAEINIFVCCKGAGGAKKVFNGWRHR